MHYAYGLCLAWAGADYEDINVLIHRTRLIDGKQVRLFTMPQALAVLNGYNDARRSLGIYRVS